MKWHNNFNINSHWYATSNKVKSHSKKDDCMGCRLVMGIVGKHQEENIYKEWKIWGKSFNLALLPPNEICTWFQKDWKLWISEAYHSVEKNYLDLLWNKKT